MSNVFNNACILRRNITCSDQGCPEGMECCQEPNSRISICCLKGSCNPKTGHCDLKPLYDKTCPIREGYNDDKHSKSKLHPAVMLFLYIIAIILFLIMIRFLFKHLSKNLNRNSYNIRRY